MTMLTIVLLKSFQSFYFGFLIFLLNFLFLFLYFTFHYFLYPAAPADHQAVLYGSPWVRNNEMLGIQIRSKIMKRKEKEPLDIMPHCSGWAKRARWAACLDIQPTHNLHCRQLLLQGDQGLVAHYDDDNTMIMMTLGIILIMPRHPNSPQLGNQSIFKKNYESGKPFNNFPNASRLKIYERSRSSSDERKGRPPGAPSLLYELRCYLYSFIFFDVTEAQV